MEIVGQDAHAEACVAFVWFEGGLAGTILAKGVVVVHVAGYSTIDDLMGVQI